MPNQVVEAIFRHSKPEIHLREADKGITEWPISADQVGHIRIPVPKNEEDAAKIHAAMKRAREELGLKVANFSSLRPFPHYRIERHGGRNMGVNHAWLELATAAIESIPKRKNAKAVKQRTTA